MRSLPALRHSDQSTSDVYSLGSEENESPSKKKQKQLPDDLADLPPLPSFKGMKKTEIKKLKKERERLEKKAAKQQAKVDAQERKRMRGELFSCTRRCYKAEQLTQSPTANEPIDLDRQCGVINDKNLPCSRSLTCKTHTVGAKRAVEGRSRPYDSLYLEWQRANNPNFKEPQKPGRKEKPDNEKKKSAKKKWGEFSMNGMSGGDHEGIREGEEGQRELEDIITFTRMAGERCKRVIDNVGSGWDTLPNGSPRGIKNRKGSTVNGVAPGPTVSSSIAANTTAAGNSSTATNGSTSGTALGNAVGATSTATTTNPAIPAAPINKGTIPYSASGIFRTAMKEYNGIGDTLTKAMATRPRGGPAAGHQSVSVNRGIPHSMATGGMKPNHGHGHGHGHGPAHIQPLPASTS